MQKMFSKIFSVLNHWITVNFRVNLDKFRYVQSAILKMITLPILPPKLSGLKLVNVSNLDIFDT